MKIYPAFIAQPYFPITKNISLNSLLLIISIDAGFAGFIEIYKKCKVKPFSAADHDTTLPLSYHLSFGKNIIEQIIKNNDN